MKCLKGAEARVCPHWLTPLERECPGCRGKGQIDVRTVEQQRCDKCHGTGRYPPPEAL